MFADFITRHTPRAVAETMGVPIPTVYTWRHRGTIPRRHWDVLVIRFGLSWPELVAMESAARQAA